MPGRYARTQLICPILSSRRTGSRGSVWAVRKDLQALRSRRIISSYGTTHGAAEPVPSVVGAIVNRALRARIEEHWADRLGCAPRFLREPGVHFAPATVVCADESWKAPFLALGSAERLVDRVALASVLEEGTRIVGPAFIGYAERLDAVLPGPERLPGAGDAALAALRAASSREEWEHAGLEEHEEPLFAAMHEGVAVAAAGFVRVLEEVAHIGVLCHPAHRKRGLGRQVVAAAAHRALALGLLAQYQTLWSNAGAIGIAQALGFEHFATTMSARHA